MRFKLTSITQLKSLKNIEGPIFRFGTSIACERFKNLPIVGREEEGGEPLFFETEDGVIYKFAQSEKHELMILALFRRDGGKIKPHDPNLIFIETQFVAKKKGDSERV